MAIKNPNPMPPELDRWNWGAFMLTWIWGIGNGVWIALLALVPFANLVMMIILGLKGNRWAWEAREWASLDEFRSMQRIWAWIGLVVWVGALLLGGILFVSLMGMMRGEAYELAMAELRGNPAAIETFGEPIEPGWFVTGSISTEGASGKATITIPVSGPLAEGAAVAEAEKLVGEWELRFLAIRPEGGSAEVLLDLR